MAVLGHRLLGISPVHCFRYLFSPASYFFCLQGFASSTKRWLVHSWMGKFSCRAPSLPLFVAQEGEEKIFITFIESRPLPVLLLPADFSFLLRLLGSRLLLRFLKRKINWFGFCGTRKKLENDGEGGPKSLRRYFLVAIYSDAASLLYNIQCFGSLAPHFFLGPRVRSSFISTFRLRPSPAQGSAPSTAHMCNGGGHGGGRPPL